MAWTGSARFNFNQTSVNANAPAGSGVYALFNDGQWIYFGESGNIRDRLTQHLNNETNQCVLRSRPQFFAYELMVGELARKKRQDQLIQEFWHLGLCNQKLG
jgi:excinuclease UvrABC nuclease subunit